MRRYKKIPNNACGIEKMLYLCTRKSVKVVTWLASWHISSSDL